jgi:ribosomal protein S1
LFLGFIAIRKQVGDTVVGQIVQFEQKGALVDVGGKASSFLSTAEVSMQRVDDLEEVRTENGNAGFPGIDNFRSGPFHR